jgi:hypothetical protein
MPQFSLTEKRYYVSACPPPSFPIFPSQFAPTDKKYHLMKGRFCHGTALLWNCRFNQCTRILFRSERRWRDFWCKSHVQYVCKVTYCTCCDAGVNPYCVSFEFHAPPLNIILIFSCLSHPTWWSAPAEGGGVLPQISGNKLWWEDGERWRGAGRYIYECRNCRAVSFLGIFLSWFSVQCLCSVVLPVAGQILLPALSDQVDRSLLHLHAGQLSTRTQVDFFM